MKISPIINFYNNIYQNNTAQTFGKREDNSATDNRPFRINKHMPDALRAINYHIYKKRKSTNREKFAKLRDKLTEKLFPAQRDCLIADWNFSVNSTNQNMKKLDQAEIDYAKVYSSHKMYKAFKSVNPTSLTPREQKQFRKIMHEFENILFYSDLTQNITDLENKVQKKRSTYKYMIDGQPITVAEWFLLRNSLPNPRIRKQIYATSIVQGDLLAKDLIKLFKMRNEFAKKNGYSDYFAYKLKKDYNIDEKYLESLISDFYERTHHIAEAAFKKDYDELKQIFGVKKLKPYHYYLQAGSNPEREVDDSLAKYDILNISKEMYKKMGFDIDKMLESGKLTLDLYSRDKKHKGGESVAVVPGKDVRIIENILNNAQDLSTLNHEFGHAFYALGLSDKLHYIEQDSASYPLDEAIANLMQDLIRRENVLANYVPPKTLKKFKKSYSDYEIKDVYNTLRTLEFEREFYKNTDQDPRILWQKMNKKYLFKDTPINNEWATIQHFINLPVYFQNYFLASLMKAQIYNYMKSVLGNITENPNTAEFMKQHIFIYGSTLKDTTIIRQLTGKEFSVDDYMKSIGAI